MRPPPQVRLHQVQAELPHQLHQCTPPHRWCRPIQGRSICLSILVVDIVLVVVIIVTVVLGIQVVDVALQDGILGVWLGVTAKHSDQRLGDPVN